VSRQTGEENRTALRARRMRRIAPMFRSTRLMHEDYLKRAPEETLTAKPRRDFDVFGRVCFSSDRPAARHARYAGKHFLDTGGKAFFDLGDLSEAFPKNSADNVATISSATICLRESSATGDGGQFT